MSKNTSTKKYFWLKFKEDFFNQLEIKKMRKIAGGDTYVIIYLKMQLLSIKNEGVLTIENYEGTEESFIENLSILIDEDQENVKIVFYYLIKAKLLEVLNENECLISKVPELIGSETESAERVRRLRARRKENELIALQCNDDVTKCNTESEIESEIDIDIYIERLIDRYSKTSWDDTTLNRSEMILNSIYEINNEIIIHLPYRQASEILILKHLICYLVEKNDLLIPTLENKEKWNYLLKKCVDYRPENLEKYFVKSLEEKLFK